MFPWSSAWVVKRRCGKTDHAKVRGHMGSRLSVKPYPAARAHTNPWHRLWQIWGWTRAEGWSVWPWLRTGRTRPSRCCGPSTSPSSSTWLCGSGTIPAPGGKQQHQRRSDAEIWWVSGFDCFFFFFFMVVAKKSSWEPLRVWCTWLVKLSES